MAWLDKIKEASQKAGEAIKEEYKKQQDKAAELKDLRGSKLASIAVEYIGGYAEYKKSNGLLAFFQNRIEFNSTFNKNNSFSIDNEKIKDIAIEGRHEVNRRVTVTRLLAVGIFAFALRKKTEDKEAFVTIVLSDGQEAVFHVQNRSPLDLKKKLAPAISQSKRSNPNEPNTGTSTNTVADELTKLAELKKQGLLTEEEFEKQKAKLLG